MRVFYWYLKADLMKTKGLSIRLMHLLIPLGISGIFLAYYSFSSWNSLSKIEAYLQVLGVGFPFLTGLFCALEAEQESAAGAFQTMLMVPKRQITFLSKLFLLLIFGIISCLLACGLFAIGYRILLKQTSVSYPFYLASAFILLGSSIFLYILHFVLALKYNKGVSIGLGIVESLVSALLLTGLGDGIWMYIPCAWASRFASLFLLKSRGLLMVPSDAELRTGTIVCTFATILLLLIAGIWFLFWDGQKGND